MDSELANVLDSLNADVLNALARQLGLFKGARRKAEVAAELDRYLNEQLSDLLQGVSKTERKLLIIPNGQLPA